MSDESIDQLIAEVDAIFDRRGLTAEDRELIFRTMTAFADWRQQETQPDMKELARGLTDPRRWARVALDNPEMLRLLESRDLVEGSFGAFLKQAVEEERARRDAGNVVDIEARRKK